MYYLFPDPFWRLWFYCHRWFENKLPSSKERAVDSAFY